MGDPIVHPVWYSYTGGKFLSQLMDRAEWQRFFEKIPVMYILAIESSREKCTLRLRTSKAVQGSNRRRHVYAAKITRRTWRLVSVK
jgi:hypothetical protein